MKLFLILLAVGCAAFLMEACKTSPIGVGPSGRSHDIAEYLPMKPGNLWNYHVESEFMRAETQKRIMDTIRLYDGSLLYSYYEDVRVSNPPANPLPSAYNMCRNGAIYVCLTLADADRDMSILLKTPIAVGTSWVWGPPNYDTLTIVSAAPGSCNGILVDTVALVVRRSPHETDSSWYGCGIGLLKRRVTGWTDYPNDTTHTLCDLEDYRLQ